MARLFRPDAPLRRLGILICAVLVASCGGAAPPSTPAVLATRDATAQAQRSSLAKNPATTQILVLSNRADLISGGDALVQIVVSSGNYGSVTKVDVDGRDVTNAFAVRADG